MFRWFVGLSVDEPVWNPPTFSKNRYRLAQADVGRRLIEKIVEMARQCNLTSNEYFRVDGTLIETWASQKSLRCKDGSDNDDSDGVGRNTGQNFQCEQRSNQTHASRTDPEAMLATKSREMTTRPSYTSHTLPENRNGLPVDAELTLATGTAERDTAIDMETGLNDGTSLGADKGCDPRKFVDVLRFLSVTPHRAQKVNRAGGSAVDGRTTPAIRATRSASACANGWRNPLAGLG